MRYASIREMDISNGDNIGISLFVQGCPFHCYNCFNPETWNFNGGKEWNEQIEKQFISLAKHDYVKRLSILGGEPLCPENRTEIKWLCMDLKYKFPNKNIWLYTGYTWEEILKDNTLLTILPFVDVLVDGRYIDNKRDITLHWRGSSNQRVIDVHKSLQENKIVLFCN